MIDYRIERPAEEDPLIAMNAVEQLYDDLLDTTDKAEAEKVLRSATPGQRLLAAYNLYDSEVNNGGHEQYFHSAAANLWRDVQRAMEAFGLETERAIFEEAIRLFPGGAPSEDIGDRQDQLESVDTDALNALDQRLYRAQEESEERPIPAYIYSHPAEFFR